MAKLDRVTFGRVIGHCVSQGMTAGEWEIQKLDELIDITVAQPVEGRANPADVDKLLELMVQGTQKIEAIKAYRHMTGAMLKESKDAVEKYWHNKISKIEICSRIEKYLIAHELFDELSVATKANELAEIIIGE